MIPRLHRILAVLRQRGTSLLQPQQILQACQLAGYDRWRNRVLDPVATIQLFLLQILHGNTACAHLPHLAGLHFSASAFCKARSRLPLKLLETVLQRFVTTLQGTVDTQERWHGHRTFLIDGSGVSMPDTPELQRTFGSTCSGFIVLDTPRPW